MAEKEIILTVRGMTFDEYSDFLDWRDEIVTEKTDTRKLGRLLVHYVFEHIYPDIDINLLTPKEAILVANRTIALSEESRDDEIKNLSSLSGGSLSAQVTAPAAEK